MWHGNPKLRYEIDLDDNIDVIITSYGVLRRDAEMLSERQFRYIILDEAQSAKNAASQNATAIRQLKSERRLALTGTPIENRPEELWTTFDFLAPGFLGSLRQFRKRYARPISRGDGQALEMLATRVQPLILRRLKSEVAKELPEKVETVIRCELNEDQRALYDHLAGRLRKEVEEKVQEVGIQKAHLDILAALTRLRQVCCDPELLKGNETLPSVPDSAKLQAFEELMREALRADAESSSSVSSSKCRSALFKSSRSLESIRFGCTVEHEIETRWLPNFKIQKGHQSSWSVFVPVVQASRLRGQTRSSITIRGGTQLSNDKRPTVLTDSARLRRSWSTSLSAQRPSKSASWSWPTAKKHWRAISSAATSVVVPRESRRPRL